MEITEKRVSVPGYENIRREQEEAERRRRERLTHRLGEFLIQESGGDSEHPAALAGQELTIGKTEKAIRYLSSEIDKAEGNGDEARRGDLMRWKASLTKR